MKKRLKPKALDVGCMIQETEKKLINADEVPKSLPQRYAELLRRVTWGGEDSTVHPPAGLSGIVVSKKRSDPAGSNCQRCDDPLVSEAVVDEPVVLSPEENPHGIQEGSCVLLSQRAEHAIRDDGRFTWRLKMSEAIDCRVVGEVRCLDTESCEVQFGSGTHWVPACCLNPFPAPDQNHGYALSGGGHTDGLAEGLLVALRPDAKAVVAVSPFAWAPNLERAFNSPAVPGVVLQIQRGVGATCRVQFGGYLWSLPLVCLEVPVPPAESDAPPAAPPVQHTYLSTYQGACQRHSCRPNSALVELFSRGPVSVLDLSDNYLGDTGLKCLAEVLSVNSTITELLLPHNSLRHDAALVVLEALRRDRLIRRVDLSHNPLNMLTGKELKSVLQVNTVITDITLLQTNISESLVAEITELAARNGSSETSVSR